MAIGAIIGILVAIVVGVNLVPMMVSTVSNVSTGSTTSDALVIVLPYIFIAVVLLGAVAYLGGARTSPIRKYINWRAFGNRLKVAYAAKFGFENKEFNKEVDIRIRGMRALGMKNTKAIYKDWLRSMADFVEVPWAVPEEEYLPEVDKTREFVDASNLTEEERKQLSVK